MELIAGDVEGFHCGFADPDALLVGAGVERAFDPETGLGRGRPNQLDDCEAIYEWSAAPILRDVAKQAVLDLVPLRCARRIVVDVDHKSGLVGELLQFELPEPYPRAIRASAVRRDRQLARIRIAPSSHAFEPAADRLHGELGGVAGDSEADEAGIGGHIVHAVGHDLAELLVLEVVHVDALRVALRTIIGSAVLEVANQLLFLRIDRDDGLLLGLRRDCSRVDIFELGVAVGMLRAFIRFAVGLARKPEFHQLCAHRVGADRMPHLGQSCSELLHAFRHPDQGSHGIAQRRWLDQALERWDELRVILANRSAPTADTANSPLRQRLRIKINLAAIDRRTGEPGNPRDAREAASTRGPHLRRRKQAPPPLVEPRAHRIPSQPNRSLIDHATDLPRFGENRNPQDLSQSDAQTPDCDSVIVRSVLKSVLAGSNVTVLTSSAADKVSREDEKWGGHGAFTKVLLDALSARDIHTRNGVISMSDLTDYINEHLKQLTGGDQQLGLEQRFQGAIFVSGL